MSYDVFMVISTGRPEKIEVAYAGNYTYNVSKMYREAFHPWGGLSDLDGVTGREAFPLIAAAVQRMKAEPERYKRMNPENGWGDYDGALAYLEKICAMAEAHPLAEIAIR